MILDKHVHVHIQDKDGGLTKERELSFSRDYQESLRFIATWAYHLNGGNQWIVQVPPTEGGNKSTKTLHDKSLRRLIKKIRRVANIPYPSRFQRDLDPYKLCND